MNAATNNENSAPVVDPGTPSDYRPRQLQIYVLQYPERYVEAAKILNLQVAKLHVEAVENKHFLLRDDVQEPYTQEFHFAERTDKQIYNLFRRIRADPSQPKFTLLVLEPNERHTEAVDAWMLRDMKIWQIRNDHVPFRNLSATDSAERSHRTTVSMSGRLEHDIHVLDEATALLTKLNAESRPCNN